MMKRQVWCVRAVAALVLVGMWQTAKAEEAVDTLETLAARVARLESQATAPGIPLHASWQNGMRLQSEDGNIQIRIGGRVQADFSGTSAESALEDAVGEIPSSGSTFRRGRLYVGGSFYKDTIFNVEYEFAGGDSKFLTTFLGVRNIPYLGTIRVGRLLEYYSLEQLSGNSFHTFMERGLSAAFNQYWGNGIGIQNSVLDGLGTWAVGALMTTDNYGRTSSDSEYNVSARLTAAPVYQDNGRTWLHLGVAGLQRRPENKEYRISSRPESSTVRSLVNTGVLSSDRVNLTGLELAATHGPFSVQSEWHNAQVDLLDSPDARHADLSGFYVYASYFLTGEHRTYSRANGTFGRVSPRSNFGGEGHGLGAWELAVRYSELDLNDGPVAGGHLRDGTVGINWYLNPNARVMFNYVRADLKDAGHVDIAQTRIQFDF
jgi:phosphate-selective porin OprO and OprP